MRGVRLAWLFLWTDGTSAPATPSHSREGAQGPERGRVFPRVTQQGQRQEEKGAGLGRASRGGHGGAPSFSTETGVLGGTLSL